MPTSSTCRRSWAACANVRSGMNRTLKSIASRPMSAPMWAHSPTDIRPARMSSKKDTGRQLSFMPRSSHSLFGSTLATAAGWLAANHGRAASLAISPGRSGPDDRRQRPSASQAWLTPAEPRGQFLTRRLRQGKAAGVRPRGERAPPGLSDRRPSAFLRTIADWRIARTESQVNHRHGRSSRTARPHRTEVDKRERKECRGARAWNRSFGSGLLTSARRLCYHVGACPVANVSSHRPRSRLGGTGKGGTAHRIRLRGYSRSSGSWPSEREQWPASPARRIPASCCDGGSTALWGPGARRRSGTAGCAAGRIVRLIRPFPYEDGHETPARRRLPMNPYALDILDGYLRAQGIWAVLVSNPFTLTWLTGYAAPIETGPSPFEGGPALGWVQAGEVTLVVS